MSSAMQRAFHTTPRDVPFVSLKVADAFQSLTRSQKRYAYNVMAAGWSGVPVVAQQLSPETLPILRLYDRVLRTAPLETVKATAVKAGVQADHVNAFVEYFASVYGNLGNYLSFGDSKFIPACPEEAFTAIVKAVLPAKEAEALLSPTLVEAIYSLKEDCLTLDYPPKGISAYYSPDITQDEVILANAYLASKHMNGVNTRLIKEEQGSLLVIRVASVEARREPVETFQGRSVCVAYGDFSDEMRRVVHFLGRALPDAANDTQRRMLEHYIEHFTTGSVDAHKASQRAWVKDVGPAVESNIGFVETYRDPSGVRGEWEGFVAVVNKAQSEVYASMVRAAPQFIAQLPWGAAYERDQFVSPDFTSLDVVGFATCGIPAGINIPNYDDVRQEDGFKNVYLGNVVNAISYTTKISHITPEDWKRYQACITTALSVNVGIHELLGHGTGKLFMEKPDGSLNVDPLAVTDLFSGEPIKTWYKPGETWGSVFGGVSASYEECRAEVVSLYLCLDTDLLRLFGCESQQAQEDVVFVAWLNMVRAGLCALEFYTPETQQWRQAHMRARFGILNALCQGDSPVVRVLPDEEEGLIIHLDETRIRTVGKQVLGDVLKHLQLYKSTADAKRGVAYYESLTSVNAAFTDYRDIVLSKRKPRKQYVQPTLCEAADGDIVVTEHSDSVEGMVSSFLARHAILPL